MLTAMLAQGSWQWFATYVGVTLLAVVFSYYRLRWAWLFPMPGTRDRCDALGAYESIRAEASLGSLVGRDGVALADAQEVRSHEAVADCLSSTTLWLPVGSPRILRGRAEQATAYGGQRAADYADRMIIPLLVGLTVLATVGAVGIWVSLEFCKAFRDRRRMPAGPAAGGQ
ncbi:hypothetical protein AB0E78_39455 [Streptomyces sp. NPDC032198]|uniref:hypothetical protein n=1 Tax=Streptomyces sp. NPDC032198 TaxID=3155127 RepID=UPI0033E36C32